ncbi:turripeptide Ici9.2-like isoform X1 [Schistocerca cancellata]|uniref:turripeptide Ici9.2-like isoform X1 n=1 Tax=Schistocerca cancellata TaxID=274614 RepID=UPI002117D7A1|nr:turripeptide Ici9.2-like isoform X1 [Schistocerca cancellata]
MKLQVTLMFLVTAQICFASAADEQMRRQVQEWLFTRVQYCAAGSAATCSQRRLQCPCPEVCADVYLPVCTRCQDGQQHTFPNCCAWHAAVCSLQADCALEHDGEC